MKSSRLFLKSNLKIQFFYQRPVNLLYYTAKDMMAVMAAEAEESTESTENTENTEYETDSGSAGQSSSDGTKTDGAGEENQNTDENEQAGADE